MEKYKHGTMTNGEKNPAAKLTWEEVGSIKEMAVDGLTFTAIAGQFGVSRTCISRICKGKTWNAQSSTN